MNIRLTAQLALSDREATLAYAVRRETRGPDGETHVAVLLSTSDAGDTWVRIPLVRTWLDGFRHWGYPTWSPEAVLELTSWQSRLRIVFRDEWVPFEPGGESLWQATQNRRGRWSNSRIRYLDYEGEDSPGRIPDVALRIPSGMRKPAASVHDDIV